MCMHSAVSAVQHKNNGEVNPLKYNFLCIPVMYIVNSKVQDHLELLTAVLNKVNSIIL